MKKLFAILLAAMMLLTMVACDIGDPPDNPNKDDPGVSESEGENTSDNNEDTDTAKVDESRTLNLYKEFFSGSYTLKMENCLKDYNDPNNKIINNSTLMVVDGENSYREIVTVNSSNGPNRSLILDGYFYSFMDESKTLMKKPSKGGHTGTVLVMQEEEFYTDMLGDVRKREIFGVEYECEVFSSLGEKITYCYQGDELKYIIGDNGGVDVIMSVVELKKGVDSSYFELPSDYEIWEING